MRSLILIVVLFVGATAVAADEPYWVFFADRGLSTAQREAALDQARASLPARTALRRAKMGVEVVGESDLPLYGPHVAAVQATGARLRQQSRWLNAVSIDASRDQLATIAALPFVTRVAPVLGLRRPEPPTAGGPSPTGGQRWTLDYGLSLAALEQIGVPAVHELGITGQGVVVGMLDTGFHTAHESLQHLSVVAAHDFINDDDIVDTEPGDPIGQHNHGTMTLSAVAALRPGALVGPAFGAAVILAKTEDTSQEVPIEEDFWVAGLEWEELLGADVVSSSLGYTDWYQFSDMDGNTAVTTIAADLAAARGVCVVNSAGNDRQTDWGHIIAPADGDDVITVGGVNLVGDIAWFSSPGPTYDGRFKPDVCALAVSTPVADPDADHQYTTASGTSLSCPLAAGVAALVLSRAPSLTPLQVREALRATADRAANPDNDFGWGVLDALAAVLYWGPQLTHLPLRDTEDTVGPYAIAVGITDRLPLLPAQMWLYWRANDSPWQRTPLIDGAGAIPGQPAGTVVSYYLEVTDSQGVTTREPLAAPTVVHRFDVGPDVTAPSLAHRVLGDQPLVTWPPVIRAAASDNLGLGRVELAWRLGNGPWQGPVLLDAVGGDAYALAFPVAAGDLQPGMTVAYTVTAWDVAGVPNAAVSGPHAFSVVDAAGVVLVIDDGGGARVAPWLLDAGYVVDVVAPVAADIAALAAHQVALLASGANPQPILDGALRATLRLFAGEGGRVLIEGGETGAAALVDLGDLDFAREVLHCAAWHAHSAGALQAVADHPVLSYPHVLPPSIAVTYTGETSQDACTPAADALLVMSPVGWPGKAGLLVHDDNDAPQAGQVVYLACDAGALSAAKARQMIENAVAYLLASEEPASATVAGRVTLVGSGDASGVTVTAGGRVAVTGPDGMYLLGPLAQGSYTVTATCSGYLDGAQLVAVPHGQHLEGVDFTLVPALAIQLVDAPQLALPDGVGGLVRPLVVSDSGACAGVSVDIVITHPQIGDLVVNLISPAGAVVRLHDRSGGESDDLVGNWPATLVVDGPGSLDDLLGQDVHGTWLLHVADSAAGNAGVWQSWGLNLLVPAPLTPVAEAGPPLATRLVGNVPNPFNPQTGVVFDLARGGAVRLEVFDVRGRLVRRLVDGRMPAGRQSVVWDGRDGGGRVVASGTYLARLTADGMVEMGKMLVVR